MANFILGDIVSLKMLGEKHYYIVTDVIDLTKENDEQPNVLCELMLIFPIVGTPKVERIDSDEIKLVASFKTKDYEILMGYIQKERERHGIFGEPEYLRIVGDDQTLVTKKPAKRGRPKKNELSIIEHRTPKFGEREIRKILSDTHLHTVIEEFSARMDTHLDLLSIAIGDGNEKEIEFQKEQLEKVRQKLMELEYFQLEQRRSGTSIKIK